MIDAGGMLDLEQLRPERLRPISRAEYEQLVALGWFEDEQVELLRGALVTMSPQGSRHTVAVSQLNELLVLGLKQRAWVRPQCSYAASEESEPEPDLAVVPRRDFSDALPQSALLMVEVADSSLRKDRRVKTSIYAENGVPESWIVNLPDEVIEVHTDPHDGSYRQVTRRDRGETLTLSAFPDVSLAVDDVLPARSS